MLSSWTTTATNTLAPIHLHIYTLYLLQLGSDVIEAEVRSQSWFPMMPCGSSDGSSWWRSGAAAAATRPAAAATPTDAVTAASTATPTAAAPSWLLLLAAAACRWLLTDLETKTLCHSFLYTAPHIIGRGCDRVLIDASFFIYCPNNHRPYLSWFSIYF